MAKEQLQLTIATPIKTVYEAQVDQVTVTTTSGEITLLPRHIPLVTTLKTGQVMVKINGEEEYMAIDGGVLEMRPDNQVLILSDKSERADEIDHEQAQKAYEAAAQAMENKENLADIDYSNLQQVMARELNRVNLAKKGKRK